MILVFTGLPSTAVRWMKTLKKLPLQLTTIPLLEPRPLSHEIRAVKNLLASGYRPQAVAFSSKTAVKLAWQNLSELWRRRLPAFALGPGTAATLEAMGWKHAQVPRRHTSHHLLQHLEERLDPGSPALLLCSLHLHQALGETVGEAVKVKVAPLYRLALRTEGLRRLSRLLRSNRRVVVVVTSARAADGLARLGEAARVWSIALSPRIAQALQTHNLEPVWTYRGGDVEAFPVHLTRYLKNLV